MAEKEYIEREELINRFEDAKEKLMNNITMSSLMAVVVIDIYISFIKKSPTADVVEVRHGRWINENFYTHCSACGKMAIYDKYGQEVESDYCPHCGAKMDGGD